MSNLYLLCGKPGCGKSTLANFMAKNYEVIYLSADDLMLKLFGEIKERNIFEEKLRICKSLIYELSEKFLLKNTDVVLDFGFWAKSERQELVHQFKDICNVVLIYLKLNDEDIFKRVSYRNNHLKSNEYYMDKSTLDYLITKFEEPDHSEDYIVYTNNDDLLKKLKLKTIKKGLV